STLTFPSTAPKYSNVVTVESFFNVITGKGMPGSSSTSAPPHASNPRLRRKIIKVLNGLLKTLFISKLIILIRIKFGLLSILRNQTVDLTTRIGSRSIPTFPLVVHFHH